MQPGPQPHIDEILPATGTAVVSVVSVEDLAQEIKVGIETHNEASINDPSSPRQRQVLDVRPGSRATGQRSITVEYREFRAVGQRKS